MTNSLDLVKDALAEVEDLISDLEEPFSKFYATFGQGHEFHGWYIEFSAPSRQDCMVYMYATYKNRWCEIYPENMYEVAISRWEYILLETVTILKGR